VTITYAGIGSTATGVNASVAPSMVAGVQTDDLLLITASIRNSGVGAVDLAALNALGWDTVADMGNLAIVGQFYTAGLTAPTVSFTGGVAGADTQAAMTAWRGVAPSLSELVTATQTNGSAQNIAFPALDVPRDGCAVLIAAWKQDDASSISPPLGWTGVINSFVTTGDDASLRLVYTIQTAEADIPGSSLAVTGGASAISKAITLALPPAAAITAAEQDVYPPRVLVSVTDLAIGDIVSVFRVVGGERTQVRAGFTLDATDTSFLVLDAELPFGVPVSYVAVVNNTTEYATSAVTYILPGGKVVLSDAVTGLAAEVVILAEGDKTYDRQSARFRVASGRNVVVANAWGQFEGSYDIFTETTSSRDQVMTLLENATEAVIQVRQPGGYDGLDAYWAVDQATEKRFSQDGSDERRIITLQVAETEPWAFELEARGYTLQDIADFYGASGTLADLDADFPSGTLLDIAQLEWS
jgi:hypothetical protein